MAITLLSLVKRLKITDNLHINLSASPKGVNASASVKVAGVNLNVGKRSDGSIGLKRGATTIAGVRMTKNLGKVGRKKKSVDPVQDTPDLLSSLLGSVLKV